MTPSLCLFYMLNEGDTTQKEKRRNYFGQLKKDTFDGNLKSTELHKLYPSLLVQTGVL